MRGRPRQQAGDRMSIGQRTAGRILGQAGVVLEPRAQLGQLPVAAGAADQGDATRQAVGPDADRHRQRGQVHQVDEIGGGAERAVAAYRVGAHRLDGARSRQLGHAQHIDVAPHPRGRHGKRLQRVLRLEHIGRTEAGAGGQDRAQRLNHRCGLRVEKAVHCQVALCHQCVFVPQVGSRRQRRTVDRHRGSAACRQPGAGRVEAGSRLRIAVGKQPVGHAEAEGGRQRRRRHRQIRVTARIWIAPARAGGVGAQRNVHLVGGDRIGQT
jgi:hypothetical protein